MYRENKIIFQVEHYKKVGEIYDCCWYIGRYVLGEKKSNPKLVEGKISR